MKKIISIGILSALFVLPFTAQGLVASEVYGGNPSLIQQPWGLLGKDTPKVAVGATVTDRYGITGVCDEWMPKYLQCNDVSNTEWYLSSIRQAFGLK